MEKRRSINLRSGKKRLWFVVVLLCCSAFGFVFAIFPKASPAPLMEAVVEPEAAEPSQPYSKFRHTDATHGRMPCLLCHKRAEGLTTPRFPGHTPCASCHAQQFAEGNQNPICSICHTETGVKPFPPLRSFNVTFDHAKHLKQTGCATCHQPTRRGVALSVPSTVTAHKTCFQCHGPRSEVGGRNIGSCGTCHQPGRPVRGSEWAKAFTMNFSHQEHIRKGNMNCSTCHTEFSGKARGRQVSSPAASMHFASGRGQSCAACHNNKRAFGAGDFANCKRCHEGKTFKF